MKVYCQCGAVAHAPKHEQNGDSSDLHCVCSDPNCGHSFVQAVGYKHTLQHSKLSLEQGAFVKQKRIFCGCGSRARITKTNRLSQNCADVYCQCTNTDCGHQFVAFSHYHSPLSPSAKTTDELASALIRSLTPERRKDLHSQLSLF